MTKTAKRTPAKSRWAPVVEDNLAQEAIHIAKTIADRILDGDLLSDNLASLREQTLSSSTPVLWDGYGLMQGFSGLAAMYNQLDRCFPKEGWRRVGSHFLKICTDIYYSSANGAPETAVDTSICSGVSGLGYIALQSPRGKSAYKLLSDHIHEGLAAELPRTITKIREGHGVSQNHYDVLYGVTGIGRYLLACQNAKYPTNLLRPTLEVLIEKSRFDGELPGLFTPHHLLHPFEQTTFGGSVVNCGLAHGIPGPLALLSLASKSGIELAGLTKSIRFWSDWLIQQIVTDQWGTNWPAAQTAGQEPSPTRAAWCYGTPGVSRSLYLAGLALNDEQLTELAAKAMLCIFDRPPSVQRNHSPTLCHGRAGILQITARFAHDTQMPEFRDRARQLCQELVETFDEKRIWGFADILNDDETVDNPGLLCGVAGVLLALLSVSTDAEPIWDQTFLLS